MNHSPSHDLISAYVDDRLSPEERAEVDALLDSSAEARAEFEAYRKLSGLLKGLPEQQAPNDLASRVMAQAERESLHGKSIAQTTETPPTNRRWLISTASLASVVVILFLAFNQFDQQIADHSEVTMSAADSTAEEAEISELSFQAGQPASPERLERSGMSGSELTEALGVGPDRFVMELGDNGLMKLIDPQDLKTAAIGDTIKGWQFQGNRVVVVQLTVVDREEVLNSMQVLLSDLSIPAESGNAESLKDENGDFYAVYVEADQDSMTTALRELQEDMNIEEMLVSANLDSRDLNPYLQQQGYSSFGASSGGATSGFASEAELEGALESSSAPQPTAQGGRQRLTEESAAKQLEQEPPQQKNVAATPTSEPAERPTPATENARDKTLTDSKSIANLPEPPPLPEDRKIAARSELSRRNLNRQVQLRLPEELGNQMIVQGALPSISNGFIQGKKATRNQIEAFQNDLNADAAQNAPAAKADATQPPALRAFTKPSTRPVQVLFVLTPESVPTAKPSKPQPKK